MIEMYFINSFFFLPFNLTNPLLQIIGHIIGAFLLAVSLNLLTVMLWSLTFHQNAVTHGSYLTLDKCSEAPILHSGAIKLLQKREPSRWLQFLPPPSACTNMPICLFTPNIFSDLSKIRHAGRWMEAQLQNCVIRDDMAFDPENCIDKITSPYVITLFVDWLIGFV